MRAVTHYGHTAESCVKFIMRSRATRVKLPYRLLPLNAQARCLGGQPAPAERNEAPGKRVTVVLFISGDHGVIHWETLPEPMTRELFSAAIVRLRAKVDNNLTYKLIVDNLSSHKRLPAGTFQHPLVGVEYLPSYAPHLNPTEEAFNVLKSEMIRQLDARRAAITATKDLPM